MLDLGLLVLRATGFLLAFTFGIQKIGWYIAGLHSDKAFSSIGLAPLIAKMGFPGAVILALWVTFNESIGAFSIGCGLIYAFAGGQRGIGNGRCALYQRPPR
jgi:hypothetical protein